MSMRNVEGKHEQALGVFFSDVKARVKQLRWIPRNAVQDVHTIGPLADVNLKISLLSLKEKKISLNLVKV